MNPMQKLAANLNVVYNMVDGRPSTTKREQYHLYLHELVEETESTRVVLEEVYRKTFHDLGEALIEAALFVKHHGGFDAWDDLDGRIGSCWMDYGPYSNPGGAEGYSVSYTLWVVQEETTEHWRNHGSYSQRIGRTIQERELRLTKRRLQIAG